MKPNRVRKKCFSILLITILLLLNLTQMVHAITQTDNAKMRFEVSEQAFTRYPSFDIKGYVNGDLKSTTFSNGGYVTFLKVGANDAVVYEEIEGDEGQIINGVKTNINLSFINDGRYVKILYTLTNQNQNSVTVSLGTAADVQIAGNDRATLERFENNKGIKLYDTSSNIQFSFYGKSVMGTTAIDNLWIGTYPDHNENCFSTNTTEKIEGQDSAFAYSWVNRSIAAGETKSYSVIIGMGEVNNAPELKLDEEIDLVFEPTNVKITGTVKDADQNEIITVSYKIDDGEEQALSGISLSNEEKNFTIDLTSMNLTSGGHKLVVWAVDKNGNPSEIEQRDIIITNLKTPEIEMNEEWSKENVTFKIKDEQNDQQDILKYQYKLGNGTWIDAQLDTEYTALSETGTINVYVKAIGVNEEEESRTAMKTAKVDKTTPEFEMEIREKMIKITATDAHSGVDKVQYLWHTSNTLPDEPVWSDYEEEMKYLGNELGDLYLHIKVIDKAGNEKLDTKEYKGATPPQIQGDSEFKDVLPKYKLVDEKNQHQNGAIYQVKVNSGEWSNANINDDLVISNPIVGENKITTRTIDVLGRVSTENTKTVTYTKTDPTIANTILPKTGIGIMIITVIVGIMALCIVSYVKYKKVNNILK